MNVSGFAKKRNFFIPEKRYNEFLVALIFNEYFGKIKSLFDSKKI